MATTRTYLSPKSNYRFLTTDLLSPPASMLSSSDSVFELNESDLWNSNGLTRSSSPEVRKPFPTSRTAKKASSRRQPAIDFGDHGSKIGITSSLPINVPDWSKILSGENQSMSEDCDGFDVDDDDDFDGGVMIGKRIIPPHEYLAEKMTRSRIVSFSIHEGFGRTLKGRDLSRVRNAVWAKTGFLD